MSPMSRVFAVVPAAGESRRMGQPKLLLPVDSEPLIRRSLACLREAPLADRVLVVRADDWALQTEAEAAGVAVVRLEFPTADMCATVMQGLAFLQGKHEPVGSDGWLLLPADVPGVPPVLVGGLLMLWQQAPQVDVLVPTCFGRRGHPVVFRWQLVERLKRLGPEQGINALLQMSDVVVREVPCSEAGVLEDVDTPEDCNRLKLRGMGVAADSDD